MDYLTISTDVGAKHLHVPFVSSRSLDANSFFNEFPERFGIRVAGRFNLNGQEPHEIADFLQSWLYFGIISELSGEEIDPSKFRALDERQRPIVQLGRLREPLSNAIKNRYHLKGDHAPDYRPIVSNHETGDAPRSARRYLLTSKHCLEMAEASLAQIEPDLLALNDHTIDVILLSIRVLIQSLSPPSDEPVSQETHVASTATRALRRMMIEMGWCVHHWNRVCCTHTLEIAYYLATLPRRNSHDNPHAACSETACSAWNVHGSPTTKHTTPGCTCSEVGVSTKQVISIINRGRLPVVSIHSDEQDGLSLKLNEWDNWTPYTAISHVWAEGLGNSRANSLPECQLRKLKDILDNLPKRKRYRGYHLVEWTLAHIRPHMFWLDTLCIPPTTAGSRSMEFEHADDRELDSANSIAIDSMSAIYAQASPTVVIDPEIYLLASTSDLSTMLAYICYCGWTTRGWTLQEGSLPKTLLFALANGFLDPIDKIRQVRTDLHAEIGYLFEAGMNSMADILDQPDIKCRMLEQTLTFRLFNRTWSQHIVPIRSFQRQETWEDRILCLAWNALIRRRTSQLKDLPIVLANLLGLAASNLKKSQDPLPAIIGSLKRIPVAFLYNTGPRLQPTLRTGPMGDQSVPSLVQVSPIVSQKVCETGVCSEIRGYGMLNAWVPSRIEGLSLPEEGPCFRVNGKVLELTRSEYSRESTAGCNVYSTFAMPTVPTTFVIRNPHTIATPMLVTTFCRRSDTDALQEIERVATGFCFVSQRRVGQSVGTGAESRAGCAVLAIVNETPQRYSTVFYCAAQIEYITNDTWVLLSEIPTVNASYIGPDCIEMLYDPDRLGHISRGSILGELDALVCSSRWLDFVSILCLGIGVYEYVIVTLHLPHGLTPLRIIFIVLLAILMPYVLAVLCLRGWALRIRIARRFGFGTPASQPSPIMNFAHTIIDYATNSALARASVCIAFFFTVNISTICFRILEPYDSKERLEESGVYTMCITFVIVVIVVIVVFTGVAIAESRTTPSTSPFNTNTDGSRSTE